MEAQGHPCYLCKEPLTPAQFAGGSASILKTFVKKVLNFNNLSLIDIENEVICQSCVVKLKDVVGKKEEMEEVKGKIKRLETSLADELKALQIIGDLLALRLNRIGEGTGISEEEDPSIRASGSSGEGNHFDIREAIINSTKEIQSLQETAKAKALLLEGDKVSRGPIIVSTVSINPTVKLEEGLDNSTALNGDTPNEVVTEEEAGCLQEVEEVEQVTNQVEVVVTENSVELLLEEDNEEENQQTSESPGVTASSPGSCSNASRDGDNWLTEIFPKRTPYFPQIGDDVIYYRQGHALYIAEVEKQKVYQFTKRLRESLPYVAYPNLEAAVSTRVVSISFDIGPPRCVKLKLAVINPTTGQLTETTFSVQYHDMENVLDFLILRQIHEKYLHTKWKVNDRFKCLIDKGWWFGTVSQIKPLDKNFPDSHFMRYNVIWDDNSETDKLSPWDMDIISDSFPVPGRKGRPVPASDDDLMTFYEATPTDWPLQENLEAQYTKIMSLIEKVMGLAISKRFLTASKSSAIAYPMDLKRIKARLQNKFYRRAEAVKFDAKMIAINAEKTNSLHSVVVAAARIVRDLLVECITNGESSDVDDYDSVVTTHLRKRSVAVKSLSRRCLQPQPRHRVTVRRNPIRKVASNDNSSLSISNKRKVTGGTGHSSSSLGKVRQEKISIKKRKMTKSPDKEKDENEQDSDESSSSRSGNSKRRVTRASRQLEDSDSSESLDIQEKEKRQRSNLRWKRRLARFFVKPTSHNK